VIAGTAGFSDLRDHAARLMKRHERHGLRRGCEDQGKGSKNAINLIISVLPCELHIAWLNKVNGAFQRRNLGF
jgi:hypothetical protein